MVIIKISFFILVAKNDECIECHYLHRNGKKLQPICISSWPRFFALINRRRTVSNVSTAFPDMLLNTENSAYAIIIFRTVCQ